MVLLDWKAGPISASNVSRQVAAAVTPAELTKTVQQAMVAFCAWTVCMVSLQAVVDAGRVKSSEKQ